MVTEFLAMSEDLNQPKPVVKKKNISIYISNVLYRVFSKLGRFYYRMVDFVENKCLFRSYQKVIYTYVYFELSKFNFSLTMSRRKYFVNE